MLLASNPQNRWSTWEYCYTRLYSECPWLNSLAVPRHASDELAYGHFVSLAGDAHTIYKVGSGEGGLIKYLASHGFDCVATEITRERGKRNTDESVSFKWHISDGINLGEFEPENHFDVVISTQVVEHMHPNDLAKHLIGVRTILRPGGKYIFNTPHALFGPADLSAVFEKPKPICMHLKEYLYRDMAAALVQAGFVNLKAVYLAPPQERKYIPIFFESKVYLAYVRALEYLLAAARRNLGIKLPKIVLRMLLLTRDVFLTAQKPS